MDEAPGVVTVARGGLRPWSGIPGRAAVLGFFSLSQGLMEVLFSFFFFSLSVFEGMMREGKGREGRGEERRGQERRGEPLCALASPFVHSRPL